MEFSEDFLESSFEISKISTWILQNDFRKVCLQFPENLLEFSVEVTFKLQEKSRIAIFLLGDSNYESCCLDFLGAEHVNADAIVHFGPVCFSAQETKIPHLYIFEKKTISSEDLREKLKNFIPNGSDLYLLVDTPYLHKFFEISEKFPENNIKIFKMDGKMDLERNGFYVYIGTNFRKLENIYFSIEDFFPLYNYDPDEMTLTSFAVNQRLVKRRNYLAEKIKDGAVFGLLMATVAVENYLKILGKLRKILKNRGKKYYVISVGKLSPEKLANFPEINVFVLIGCSMNGIFENERNFYAPLVTPSDVIFAFSSKNSGKKNFSYDFNVLFRENFEENLDAVEKTPDISLISGKIRHNLNLAKEEDDVDKTEEKSDLQISDRTSLELMENQSHGAGFLASKSWRGLEQNTEKSMPKLATEGRSGIPLKYHNEPR